MRTWFRLLPIALLPAVPAALAASPVYAHGFGERYSLPVPLEYYLAGAGAAVALSFALIGLFVGGTPTAGRRWRFNLLAVRGLGAFLQSRLLTLPIRAASVSLLALVVAAGFLGTQDTGVNIAPTLVWVVWWVGLGYFVALIGNLWPLVNPWSIAFGWAEGLLARIRPGLELDLGFEYPRALGVWPAFALFLGFAWLENAYPGASEPETLALAVVFYSAVTWGGMLMFGRHTWLRYGEAFSVVFGVMARFAPTEVVTRSGMCDGCESDCESGGDGCVNCYERWSRAPRDERQLNLRPFAVGLAGRERVSTDVMALVLLVLAAVTFDGLGSTPLWAEARDALFSTASAAFGVNAVIAIDTMGLLLIPALFAATYLLFSWVMATASGGDAEPMAMGAGVCLLARAHCAGVQHRPLLPAAAGERPGDHLAGIRPVRIRLGPAGHGGLRDQPERGERAGHVAGERWRDCAGAHHRGVRGARDCAAHDERPAGGAAQPVPDDGLDDRLHRGQPVDHRPAYCGVGGEGPPPRPCFDLLSTNGADCPCRQLCPSASQQPQSLFLRKQ